MSYIGPEETREQIGEKFGKYIDLVEKRGDVDRSYLELKVWESIMTGIKRGLQDIAIEGHTEIFQNYLSEKEYKEFLGKIYDECQYQF